MGDPPTRYIWWHRSDSGHLSDWSPGKCTFAVRQRKGRRSGAVRNALPEYHVTGEVDGVHWSNGRGPLWEKSLGCSEEPRPKLRDEASLRRG